MTDQVFSSTAYDDVFRTLLNDCSKLIIPVINEAFGENYTGNEIIQFFPNEHFLNQQEGGEEKRITDTSFAVTGTTTKRYHFECQSTADYSILIRIFEYDAQIALDQDSMIAGNRIIVSFPHTAVLFLRSTTATPDEMEIVIRTPGGEVIYNVPVLKVRTYTIDEIFTKNLLFLIPFYIFTYESQFQEIERNADMLREVVKEYEDIAFRLEKRAAEGSIDEYTKKTIMDMSERVLMNLAKSFENIRKGVGSVMGGKILDYEAKRIRNEGRHEGIAGAVTLLRSMGVDDRVIMEKIQVQFDLKPEEAERYVLASAME